MEKYLTHNDLAAFFREQIKPLLRQLERQINDTSAAQSVQEVVFVDYWQSNTPTTDTAGLMWYSTSARKLYTSYLDGNQGRIVYSWEEIPPLEKVIYVGGRLAHYWGYVLIDGQMVRDMVPLGASAADVADLESRVTALENE